MLVLILFYALVFSFLPRLSQQATLALHFSHALAWCIFHCFGLGFLLRAQSERKFIVRHFVKHYHYPPNDDGAGALQEAFTNWKSIYNLSLCMTYGTHFDYQLTVPDSSYNSSVQFHSLALSGSNTRSLMYGLLAMTCSATLWVL
jgi:hypothetical protein